MEKKMEKYDVTEILGKGTFGVVYKAKDSVTGDCVALKIISKRDHQVKELEDFKRESEIQRDLHHPNIIQMFDSFETKNEIVFIIEYAPKVLPKIMNKKGLGEKIVQPIVCDLLSALYYLHSNRILHRDLKPQNILLDLDNRVKLCDFGFARNMSTGTHFLISTKGTPLYMAPEIMNNLPYDYSADLWSLGCVIYELLLGTPPFFATSMKILMEKITTEEIEWPRSLSLDCTNFLKGLLQIKPANRMTWKQILNHPLVKGQVYISKSVAEMPLTCSLSNSLQEAKKQQIIDINNKQKGAISKINLKITKQNPNSSGVKSKDLKSSSKNYQEEIEIEPTLLENNPINFSNKNEAEYLSKCLKEKLNFTEDHHPIEPEEWIVFLKRSIQEVMNGELSALMQPSLTNIIVSPLRNSNLNSKVLIYVAKLLAIAFVVKGTSEDTVKQIKKVYMEVKLLPNLIYACKLLLRKKTETESGNSSADEFNIMNNNEFKLIDDLKVEELQALEHVLMLICHLIHLEDDFIMQFCDAVVLLNVFTLFNQLLGVAKRKIRIPMDLLSILTQTIRRLPENVEIVEKIALNEGNMEKNQLHLGEFLRNSNYMMRERTCHFILLIGKYFQQNTLEKLWTIEIRETLEGLVCDSIESVRNAAEATVNDLKHKEFYINGQN